MSSSELTQWIAYFELKEEERKGGGVKLKPSKENFQAMFGDKVKKKQKGKG